LLTAQSTGPAGPAGSSIRTTVKVTGPNAPELFVVKSVESPHSSTSPSTTHCWIVPLRSARKPDPLTDTFCVSPSPLFGVTVTDVPGEPGS
jgi:hypothetical protein